tara:strand:+ start:4729 stop:5073 length:345 start_codon:yes stop_codon:yes gene_type:complete
MAKKKELQNNVKLPALSFEITKITLDNVKEFFESPSLFIVISEGVIVNQFLPREILVKDDNVKFYHIFNGDLVCKNVKIYTNELQDDYDNSISDMKVLIKDYIKRNILYGARIT